MLDPAARTVILGILRDLGKTSGRDEATCLMIETLAVLTTLTENGALTRDDGLRIVMALCGYDDDPSLVEDILDSI
ncbi:hypothetical protein STSO111631_12675 [Stackebrandtia soli]